MLSKKYATVQIGIIACFLSSCTCHSPSHQSDKKSLAPEFSEQPASGEHDGKQWIISTAEVEQHVGDVTFVNLSLYAQNNPKTPCARGYHPADGTIMVSRKGWKSLDDLEEGIHTTTITTPFTQYNGKGTATLRIEKATDKIIEGSIAGEIAALDGYHSGLKINGKFIAKVCPPSVVREYVKPD